MAAEAYASAEAGLFTKTDDGKLLFNPNIDAKMGASFTALHLDAEGHVGNEMLGAKGNVVADVGYADGVLSLDIGASLGVGASIAFEVNIGGTVDAVKDAAKSVFSWFK